MGNFKEQLLGSSADTVTLRFYFNNDKCSFYRSLPIFFICKIFGVNFVKA